VWTPEADEEAIEAFRFDRNGNPWRFYHLYAKVDQLDAYCAAANAALDTQRPEEPELSWFERGWLGRLLRWPSR
jgi:hypothetical protein